MALVVPEARWCIVPAGIVTTEGPSLNGICDEVGIPLSQWQKSLTAAAAGKGPDGLYAAETVALSVSRQSGKTHWARAYVFAQCIKHPGTTVAWTAHHTKVAAESFASLKVLAMSDKVAPHIKRIVGARGSESIEFVNGSRILMAAREKAGLRGFAKVRILVLDEAQILTEAAMSDMVPTMNQAWNPQIVMMGTPPRPQDPGEVFTNRRLEAIEAAKAGGQPEGVFYFETSADEDAETDDRTQWRLANPSFPKFTPVKAMLRMRRELTEENFRREALGIWDDKSAPDVIAPEAWAACSDPDSKAVDRKVFAVDVNPRGDQVTIAAAGVRADGLRHVEVVATSASMRATQGVTGTDWVVPWLAERLDLGRAGSVVMDSKSPAAALFADALQRAKVRKVTLTATDDMAAACAGFKDAVESRKLRHIDQVQLSVALGSARKRGLPGDRWAWSRKNDAADITPLVAATLAVWAVDSSKVKHAAPHRRSGRGRAVVM